MATKDNKQQSFIYISFASVMLLTIVIYSVGLNGPFIFDDFINLEPLHNLESGLMNWWDVLRSSPHGMDRPVSMLSFIANWIITGDDIWYLKLTNVLIHLLCGLIIFYLSYILLSLKRVFENEHNKYLALFIMSLWLLSPYQVSTVLYVIQRMAQLSTLFMLLGVLCYVFGREKIDKENLKQGLALIVISFGVCLPLAFFSKQNAAIFPLVIFIIEVFFFDGSVYTKKLRRVLITFMMIPILYISFKVLGHGDWVKASYSGRDFSLYERLITQARILFDYASNLLLLPGGSAMGLFHDDYIKSSSLWNPITTVLSVCGLLIIVCCSILYKNSTISIVLFGILLFISGHLVESSFLPLELFYEHRNYFPSVGLYFSVGAGVGFLLLEKKYFKIIIMLMIIISLWFALLTFSRAITWQSLGGILHASVKSHPESWRTHTRLANISMLNGEKDIALMHLKKASEINENKGLYGIRLSQLITNCFSNNKPEEKFYQELEQTNIVDDTYTFSILRWFNKLLATNECKNIDEKRVVGIIAQSLVNVDIKEFVKHWELHFYVGQFYSTLNEKRLAVDHYLKAYDLNRDYYDSAILALKLQLDVLDYAGAKELLRVVDKSVAYKYRYQQEIFNEYRDMLKTK